MTQVYSHLARRMVPLPPARPAKKPNGAQAVDNSALEAAAQMVEDLQGQLIELEARLAEETRLKVQAEHELDLMRTERQRAESKYLEEAVRRGEAEGARTGLESALANANATNTKLAAMKPPPAPKPVAPAPPPQWKMEVHRDGLGNIREIIATPQGK